MSLLEFLAGVRTLKERSAPVSQLADVVVTPVDEAAKIECGDAMPPSALEVVDKARLILLVKYVRQIWNNRQILDVACSVDTKGALQIITACVHLLENLTSFLTLSNKNGEFLSCCRIDHKKLRQWAHDPRWHEQGMLRI